MNLIVFPSDEGIPRKTNGKLTCLMLYENKKMKYENQNKIFENIKWNFGSNFFKNFNLFEFPW